MNFKDWEKLEETDKSCTLRHPKGHVMTIAVKALPRIQQEQIKRLKFAHGGDVLESEDGDGTSTQGKDVRHAHKAKMRGDKNEHEMGMHHAKEEAKGRSEMERHNKPKIQGLAHGGELKGHHKNGNVSDSEVRTSKGYWDSEEGKKALASANANAEDTKRRVNEDKPKKYADGTKDGPVGEDDSNDQGDTQPDATTPAAPTGGTTINYIGTPSPGAQPQATQAPLNPTTQFAQRPIPDTPVESKPTIPNVSPTGQLNPGAIEANTQTIAENQKNIDIAMAKKQADIEQGNIDAQGAELQKQRERYDDMNKHVDDFANYTNANPINPNHYQENMGSGQKVSGAIGLFLGGFGSANQFGGQNYAMDFLNKQIDRDIEGQKARMDQQKTILGAYRHLYGDSMATYNLTKASMLDIYNAKMRQAAFQLGTPQAIQKYQAFAVNSALEKQGLIKNSAVETSALPGSAGGSRGQNGTEQPMSNTSMPMANRPNPAQKPDGESKADWYDNHILHPSADNMMMRLQYNPQAKEVYPALMEQKSKADLADKAINTINKSFPDLLNETGNAEYSNKHLGSVLGGVPFVGGILGNSVDALSDTETRRNYDSDKENIRGAIRGALQGNVSEDLLNEVVDKNSPTLGDEKNPKLAAKKLKNLKDFIQSHTKTDLLRTFGMSKK